MLLWSKQRPITNENNDWIRIWDSSSIDWVHNWEINFESRKRFQKLLLIKIQLTYERVSGIESNFSTADPQFESQVPIKMSTATWAWNEDEGLTMEKREKEKK